MRIWGSILGLALTIGLVAGCTGATSPAPGSSGPSAPAGSTASTAPAASTAPSADPARIGQPAPMSSATAAPPSWGTILGDQRTFAGFTLSPDPAHDGNVLVVKESGETVGSVYLDLYPTASFTFDVSGFGGLSRVATAFVESLRLDRTTSDPAGTFTPMPATEVAFGASRGFRSGFAWKDHVGNLERWVQYVAAAPGSIVTVSASAVPALDVGRAGFRDDATLVRFLPVLD
jgi:hypothetical protein